MAKTQAQSLKPVISHEMHWELIDNYLAGEIDRHVKLLLQCTPEQLRKIQGAIEALEKLREMPRTLRTELGA